MHQCAKECTWATPCCTAVTDRQTDNLTRVCKPIHSCYSRTSLHWNISITTRWTWRLNTRQSSPYPRLYTQTWDTYTEPIFFLGGGHCPRAYKDKAPWPSPFQNSFAFVTAKTSLRVSYPAFLLIELNKLSDFVKICPNFARRAFYFSQERSSVNSCPYRDAAPAIVCISPSLQTIRWYESRRSELMSEKITADRVQSDNSTGRISSINRLLDHAFYRAKLLRA